jgi:hypothetical protein
MKKTINIFYQFCGSIPEISIAAKSLIFVLTVRKRDFSVAAASIVFL